MSTQVNAITVIDAKEEDLDAINRILLLSKAYWGYDQAFLDRFMKEMRITASYLKQHTTKLCFNNNTLVGFYSFVRHADDSLELDNFFLLPDFIGQGLGHRLWFFCCETARELGKEEFIIWSDPNAEAFYLKMGCEKIGTRQSSLLPNRYPAVFRYHITKV